MFAKKYILLKKALLMLVISLFLTNSNCLGQDSIDTSAYVKDNLNLYALLIAQNGKIVKRAFYNNYSDSSLFNDQSLTKNVCSLLIGIAIDHYFIKSIDQKLTDFFPQLSSDPDQRKSAITIRQVINQASGLYHEDLTRLFSYFNGVKFTYGMGWGGQFLVIVPSLKAVIVINQSVADKTALKQSTILLTIYFR